MAGASVDGYYFQSVASVAKSWQFRQNLNEQTFSHTTGLFFNDILKRKLTFQVRLQCHIPHGCLS